VFLLVGGMSKGLFEGSRWLLEIHRLNCVAHFVMKVGGDVVRDISG
jgi:hypothetical protein